MPEVASEGFSSPEEAAAIQRVYAARILIEDPQF
jgi:hypothetical protein